MTRVIVCQNKNSHNAAVCTFYMSLLICFGSKPLLLPGDCVCQKHAANMLNAGFAAVLPSATVSTDQMQVCLTGTLLVTFHP